MALVDGKAKSQKSAKAKASIMTTSSLTPNGCSMLSRKVAETILETPPPKIYTTTTSSQFEMVFLFNFIMFKHSLCPFWKLIKILNDLWLYIIASR